MSTEQLLHKLKRFLPNNTANKLLTDDLIFLEEGSVLVIKFNLFNRLLVKLNEISDFTPVYKSIFNDFITETLNIIYENGGIFLNLSDNKIDIVFTKELIGESQEDIVKYSLNCAVKLKEFYHRFVKEITSEYEIELDALFTAGLANGKFLEIIFGNEKRKERIALGMVAKRATDCIFCGCAGEINVSPELHTIIKGRVESCKKKNIFTIKSISYNCNPVDYNKDKYLNLKTSIIKSFLPEYIYSSLKDNPEEEFVDIKKGSIIDVEFSKIHEHIQEYIDTAAEMTDETEHKVYTDNYFFSLNKLIKKIFRLTANFDGAVNKLELSKLGMRIIITFSFPKTFDNDPTNKMICVEEIRKVCASYKKLEHRIIHFEDKMFASIIGSKDRGAYIITSEFTPKIDRVIDLLGDGELREVNPDVDLKTIQKLLEKDNAGFGGHGSCCDGGKVVLKGLFTHKVIGRNKEIINLNQLLRAGGKIITLAGWQGIGKTRMVEEIVKRMSNENFHIIHSKVEDRDNIIDLFKYLIEEESGISLFDKKEIVKQKLDKYFKHLLTFSPVKEEKEQFRSKLFILYKLMYNIDEPGSIYKSLTPDLRLTNLKEALSLLVIFNYYHHIKRSEGVIFIFDDIDSLMHEEKELMQYVIQYSISHLVEMGNRRNKKGEINKISFLITYHMDDDLKFNKYLKPFKQELPPLKKDTMRLLLKQLSRGKKMSSEVEKVILKLSSGNPFFLEQYFRFVFTEGMVLEKDNLLEKTKKYKKKFIPTDIKEIVKRNLSKLTEKQLELLQACSVIGVKFDHTIVRKYYPDFSFKDLEEIEKSNFIKKYHLENHYIFSHPIINEVVYANAGTENRKKWHRGVAKMLEMTKEISKMTHSSWLGYHYYQAGDQQKAVSYLKQSYEDAKEKNFIESAYHDLQKLISYTDESAERDKLVLDEIRLLFSMKEYVKARKTSYPLLKKYERSENYDLYLDILLTIIENSLDFSPAKKIKELLQKASNILRKHKLTDIQKGRLYKFYALFKKKQGNVKLTVNYIKKSLSLIMRTKDYDNKCFLLNELGMIYEAQFRFSKSIITFQKGLKTAEKNNDLKHQSILLGNLGKITYKLGKVKDSLKYYEKALNTASMLSLKDVEGTCAGQLGNIYLEIRDITSAISNFERSIKIFRALNDLEEISYRLSDLGACCLFHNNYQEAEKYFNKSIRIAKEINSSLARAYALMHIGRLKVLKQSYSDAEKNFKESLKIYREKKLYKRMGMIYYYISEMYYIRMTKFESGTLKQALLEMPDETGKILKNMKHSLFYSKKSKNIHFISLAYLLQGKILKKSGKIRDAVNSLQSGYSSIKISDYSRLYIDIVTELSDAFHISSRNRDALLILKAAQKRASANKDMKTRNKLKDMIKELSE
ncbi:MAG: tetratricopeptide repeat protein [Candidatus Delongbacteria bacterium]